MRPLHCAIIYVTVRFEYLALDEVRRTHRISMILSGISSRDTIRSLERRTVLCNCIEFQSLETRSGAYSTLNTIFRIIRFMDYGCSASGAIGRVRVDSLGIATVRGIIYLRSRLGIARIRR